MGEEKKPSSSDELSVEREEAEEGDEEQKQPTSEVILESIVEKGSTPTLRGLFRDEDDGDLPRDPDNWLNWKEDDEGTGEVIEDRHPEIAPPPPGPPVRLVPSPKDEEEQEE